ncbi:uncharacterized protein LOC141853725 [Brevipalpus obovatus]|uniref:uncharacterized protein LOC141853725 n=1 Tax=Brevipalpus obovatus TaxID=246614 RepID=UPI003D9E1C99
MFAKIFQPTCLPTRASFRPLFSIIILIFAFSSTLCQAATNTNTNINTNTNTNTNIKTKTIVTINNFSCPQNCTCSPDDVHQKLSNSSLSTYKVICERKKLAILPAVSDSERVTYFSVYDNQIGRIDSMDTLPELLELKLSINQIDKIEPKAFENLSKLESLDLGFNSISDLPSGAFEGLNRLKKLILQRNSLRRLREDIFQNLSSLEELDLTGNLIRSLPDDIFRPCTRLQRLVLQSNRFHTLPDTIFHDNIHLSNIDISYCEFGKVPIDPLRGAEELSHLDISGNLMRTLDQDSFTGLNNLEFLLINDMKTLRTIGPYTFSSLCKLKRLHIYNNAFFDTLDKDAFHGMTANGSCLNLEDVDLHANQLSTLHPRMLPICKIAKVDLRDNQWRCDCTFRWVKSCRKNDPIHQQITCLEPLDVRNIEISNIAADKFVCPSDQTPFHREIRLFRLFVVSFGVLILFFTLVMIVFYLHKIKLLRSHTNKYQRMGSIHYVKAPNEIIE